jgi:exodeoxyribonuclease-1
MPRSFYWYDLETFGTDPRRTRIAQFAGRRTDLELRPVGEPLVLYCRPADDLLPSPGACLVTGITPQHCLAHGLPEAEFVARLHEELAQPGTCAVGYNSLRFDEEFLRCALYRNFRDPYAREWKNGNSRWDLLDLARLQHALRPDGLEWPRREDGHPSFRLEHLAAANGITHARAHDALSDVEALISLAARMQRAQPRLFDYYLALRDKHKAAALLDCAAMTPVLHVSGRIHASRRCAAAMLPITPHPVLPNRVIAFDLSGDPAPLLADDADDLADRLWTPAADLPEGEARLALKEIHTNRCPALVAWEHLRDQDFALLGMDQQAAEARAALLRAAPGLAERVRALFASRPERAPADPDMALYDGFPDPRDRRLAESVAATPPAALAGLESQFADPRYAELLFRYRARNFPDTLDATERTRWDAYRRRRLDAGTELSEYDLPGYFAEIAALRSQHPEPGPTQALLDALEAWGHDIATTLEPVPALPSPL